MITITSNHVFLLNLSTTVISTIKQGIGFDLLPCYSDQWYKECNSQFYICFIIIQILTLPTM